MNWNRQIQIDERIKLLGKRKLCIFAYRCANRALKYARQQDLPILDKILIPVKEFIKTGDDNPAVRNDMWHRWKNIRSSVWSERWAMWCVWGALFSPIDEMAASNNSFILAEIEGYDWQIKELEK